MPILKGKAEIWEAGDEVRSSLQPAPVASECSVSDWGRSSGKGHL